MLMHSESNYFDFGGVGTGVAEKIPKRKGVGLTIMPVGYPSKNTQS